MSGDARKRCAERAWKNERLQVRMIALTTGFWCLWRLSTTASQRLAGPSRRLNSRRFMHVHVVAHASCVHQCRHACVSCQASLLMGHSSQGSQGAPTTWALR